MKYFYQHKLLQGNVFAMQQYLYFTRSLKAVILTFLALIIFLPLLHGQTAVAPSMGDGSPENPFEIQSLENLYWLTENPSEWDKHFVLMQDINAEATQTWNDGKGFSPLGNSETPFSGSWFGSSQIIFEIHINRPDENDVGFFGQTHGAKIRHFEISYAKITGSENVGGLVGRAIDTDVDMGITRSSIITGISNTGGLVGRAEGSLNRPTRIHRSFVSHTEVVGSYSSGGLVGYMFTFSTIINSYANKFVTVRGQGTVGGLAGTMYGLTHNFMLNCYSAASVEGLGEGASGLGGLIGFGTMLNEAIVGNSFWDIQESGQEQSAGGTGKTTAELQQQSTFDEAGWNFSKVWNLLDYPVLHFTPYEPEISLPPGEGSAANPFVIENLENLVWLSQSKEHWDKHFVQTADIDASETGAWFGGTGLKPIGSGLDNAFSGVYNGQGFSISNLTTVDMSNRSTGLFGVLTGAEVKNLHLENALVAGRINTGALAGELNGSAITSASVSGFVFGLGLRTGGLAGMAGDHLNVKSLITRSASHAHVFGREHAGGMVGYNAGNIANSYALGNVYGSDYLAGFAAINEGFIINSYAAGVMNDKDANEVGGFITANSGEVKASFWDVDVTGQATSSGGDGKTSAEMKQESTFSEAGWDFQYMWDTDAGVQEGYPVILPGIIPLVEAPLQGDGSPDSPWEISSLENLAWLSETKDVWGDAFIQTAHIDASSTEGWFNGEGFTPIGDELRDYLGYFSAFTGTYDGQGYAIKNLTVNKPAADNVGLFGFTHRAVINNVVLENVNVKGHNHVGGLVGSGKGLAVSGSHVEGNVAGNNFVGGVAGLLDQTPRLPYIQSSVTYSASLADVAGEVTVGGFAGRALNNTNISNCYTMGDVTGKDIIGGFTGSNGSTIETAYAAGVVTAIAGEKEEISVEVGGFAAINTGNITASFWDIERTGQEESAGAEGKTTAQMQTAPTYTDAGWNFDFVWHIAGINHGYPFLMDSEIAPEGKGTYEEPYRISALSHLYWISQHPFSWVHDKHFIQLNDIDASTTQTWENGKGFSPIGYPDNHFRGIYDGQGYVISGLYINRPEQDEVGFFGRTWGVVKNLGLIDVDITGKDDIGAIAGSSGWGDIHHSYTTGKVTGNERVGGLVGFAGSINFSYSLCELIGGSRVGGLVGETRGNILYSYAAGTVTGNTHTGGLAGATASHYNGVVLASFWDAEASGQSQSALGDGKTTAQMQQQETFTDAGWDFTWLWKLDAAENEGYPYFGPYVLPEVQAPQAGDGSEGNPWKIASLQQLAWVSLNPQSWEKHFLQVEAIDASGAEGWFYGQGFAPIGNNHKAFSGTYNGNGTEILSLPVKRKYANNTGLFGLTEHAHLYNIQLRDVSIYGHNYVGAIAGKANRTNVFQCFADGNVAGHDFVGGVTGDLYFGEMEQSVSTVYLKGNRRVGGLVGGSSYSEIKNSYAAGTVEGTSIIGGLAGRNEHADGSIVNSYSASIVKTGTNTGGLLGENVGVVENSYWDTEMSGQENSPGGEGKTTDEMILGITFEDWDFAGIWQIEEGETYPYLQWQGTPQPYNYPRSYYPLTLVVYPVDAGTAEKEGEYAEGSFVSLSAAATAGYVFGWWADAEGNIISESAAFEYIMASDATTLTAHFIPIDYELNVQVSPAQGGNYEVSPEKEFYHVNDIITLTAIPAQGYEVSEWKDHEMNTMGVEEVAQFTMPAQDAQIVLGFRLIDYELTVHVNNEDFGSVNIQPEKEFYNMGDEVTLTAVSNPGYAFELWEDAEGETVSTETAYSFVMSAADAEYTARFKLKDLTFDVNVVPAGGGVHEISPDQDFYTMGQEIQLSATAEAGYEFVSWNDADGGIVSSQDAFTYTMGPENTVLEARFQLIDYTLSVVFIPENAGSVTFQPQKSHYNKEDEVILSAIEEEGYEFVSWNDAQGNQLTTAKSFTFTMPADDVVLTANYALKTYALTVSVPEGNGTLEITPEQEYYNMGDVIELKATPDEGYRFASWRDGHGNTLSTESEFVYTMPARNITIFARFVLEQYSLEVQVEPSSGGYVTVSPNLTHYTMGSQVMLSAEPYPGYTFARWKDEEGNELSTQESYNLTFPASDVVVRAEFEYVYYDFAVNVDPQGAGTVEVSPDRDSFHVGEVIELKATAEEGWRFHSWRKSSGVTISSDEEFSYTMPSQSVSLVAYFEALLYEFQVTATPYEAGYVEWVPGQTSHYAGDLISLYAHSYPGYEFLHWSDEQGEVLGTTPEMDFVMPTKNVSLTAHFDLMDLMLFLDVYPEAGGSIEASPVQESYHMGDVVTLTAVPASNYIFLRWTNDEGHEISTHKVLEFDIPHHHTTVAAHFDLADSVEELVEDGIQVYPNPSRARLLVETPKIARRIELLDAHGRMVKSLEPTSLLTQMDVSDFVSGMYIVRIVNDDGVVSRIIQVQQN